MHENALMQTFSLNDQQRLFVDGVVSGLPRDAAAAAAGYGEGAGYAMQRHPKIMAAIHAEVARRIRVEDAPLARQVLNSIVRNELAPWGVRADCAKTLLARAGHVEPRTESKKPDAKDLADMTADELRNVIDDCEKRLSDQATPVGAPLGDGAVKQAIDMFE